MFGCTRGVSQTKKSIDEMKRTSALVVVLLAVAAVAMVGFSSCKKERNKSKLLIKKWTIEKVTGLAGGDLTWATGEATFDFQRDGKYVMTVDKEKAKGLLILLPEKGEWNMAEDGTWVKLNGVKYTIEEESDWTRINLSGPVKLTLK